MSAGVSQTEAREQDDASRLRVLLMGAYPPPRGGASVYLQRLADALQHRGLAVTVAGLTRGGSSLPAYVAPFRSESEARSLLRTERFDVVHHLRLHPTFRRRNLIAALLSVLELVRMAPPLLVTCGAGGFADDLRRAGLWRRWVVRQALRKVHHFWTKLEPLIEQLTRLGLDPTRCSYLSSALPLGDLPPPDGEVAEFAARQRPLVVASGWLYQPIYRLDMVVRAVGRIRHDFPEVGLVLGASRPFDPQGRPAVDRAIEASNMNGRVLHLDDYDRFPSLLAAADASVRATVVEGSSNVVLESLLVGCPVLASDLPNRPEGAILFPRDDEDALVAALRNVLRHPPPRRPDPAAQREAHDNLERICRTYVQAAGRVK